MKNLLAYTLKSILLVSISILVSNCSGNAGLTRNINNHQTDVVLSQPNYKVIKYVQGESTAKYFLGIGGFGNKGMIAQARKKMLQHAGLIGKSRAVINETVEIQTKQILLYTEFRYIVSAYIVEFSSNPDDIAITEPDVLTGKTNDIEFIEETVMNTGITAGISISGDSKPLPGFNFGLSGIFSKPKTHKNWFLENQANFTYLSSHVYNSFSSSISSPNKLHSFSLDFPVYAGYSIPLTSNYGLFIKGGPGLGLLYYNELNPNNTSINSDFMMKVSLGGFTGFRLGKFSTAIGLEYMVGDYFEFSSVKLALTYQLN
jgi:hypothetical protein